MHQFFGQRPFQSQQIYQSASPEGKNSNIQLNFNFSINKFSQNHLSLPYSFGNTPNTSNAIVIGRKIENVHSFSIPKINTYFYNGTDSKFPETVPIQRMKKVSKESASHPKLDNLNQLQQISPIYTMNNMNNVAILKLKSPTSSISQKEKNQSKQLQISKNKSPSYKTSGTDQFFQNDKIKNELLSQKRLKNVQASGSASSNYEDKKIMLMNNFFDTHPKINEKSSNLFSNAISPQSTTKSVLFNKLKSTTISQSKSKKKRQRPSTAEPPNSGGKSKIKKKNKDNQDQIKQIKKQKNNGINIDLIIQESLNKQQENLKQKKQEQLTQEKIKKAKFLQYIMQRKKPDLQNVDPVKSPKVLSKSKEKRLPWGSNEKRLIEYYTRFQNTDDRDAPNDPQKYDDNVRRAILGVSFLNKLDENEILQIKKQSIIKLLTDTYGINPLSSIRKNQFTPEEQQEIHEYMQWKKMQMKIEEITKKQKAQEEQQKKNQNLEQLYLQIHKQVSKPKPKKQLKKKKSKNIKQCPPFDAEYKQKEIKEQDSEEEQSIPLENVHPSELEKNSLYSENDFSYIYQEWKKILQPQNNTTDQQPQLQSNSLIEKKIKYKDSQLANISKSQSTKQDLSTKKNKTQQQQQDQYQNLQTAEISNQPQQQQIMQSQKNQLNKIQNLQKKYHEIVTKVEKNLVRENQTLEQNLNNLIHSMDNTKAENQAIKGRSHILEDEDINDVEGMQQDFDADVIPESDEYRIEDGEFIPDEEMIPPNGFQQNIEDIEDQLNQGEDEHQQMPSISIFEALEAAVIFIQKVWRGYRTRKILSAYLKQIFEYEQIDYFEYEDYPPNQQEQETNDNTSNVYQFQQQIHQNYQNINHYIEEEEDDDIGTPENHFSQNEYFNQYKKQNSEVSSQHNEIEEESEIRGLKEEQEEQEEQKENNHSENQKTLTPTSFSNQEKQQFGKQDQTPNEQNEANDDFWSQKNDVTNGHNEVQHFENILNEMNIQDNKNIHISTINSQEDDYFGASQSVVEAQDISPKSQIIGNSNNILNSGLQTQINSNLKEEKKEPQENSLSRQSSDKQNNASSLSSNKFQKKKEDLDIKENQPKNSSREVSSILNDKSDKSQFYIEEVCKLKEEEIRKWDDIISKLQLLQQTGGGNLNENAIQLISELQKQSEENKQFLQKHSQIHKKKGSLKHQDQLLFEQKNTSSDSPFYSPNQKLMIDEQQQVSLIEIESQQQVYQQLNNFPESTDSKQNKSKQPQLISDDQRNPKNLPENLVDLDLSQMRLALGGSEVYMREHSARTLSQSVSSPSKGIDLMESDKEEAKSFAQELDNGSSIFESEPFKEFTKKKFKELLEKQNISQLLKMREKSLDYSHKTQVEYMKKMLENKNLSPRDFHRKRLELERWVTKEKEDIKKSQKQHKKNWLKCADAIHKTQRNIQFMQKFIENPQRRNSLLQNSGIDVFSPSGFDLRNSFSDDDMISIGNKRYSRNSESEIESNSAQNNMVNNSQQTESRNIKVIDHFELKDNNIMLPQNQSPKHDSKFKKDYEEESLASSIVRDSQIFEKSNKSQSNILIKQDLTHVSKSQENLQVAQPINNLILKTAPQEQINDVTLSEKNYKQEEDKNLNLESSSAHSVSPQLILNKSLNKTEEIEYLELNPNTQQPKESPHHENNFSDNNSALLRFDQENVSAGEKSEQQITHQYEEVLNEELEKEAPAKVHEDVKERVKEVGQREKMVEIQVKHKKMGLNDFKEPAMLGNLDKNSKAEMVTDLILQQILNEVANELSNTNDEQQRLGTQSDGSIQQSSVDMQQQMSREEEKLPLPRGIKTNINAVRSYLENLVKVVQEFYMDEVLKNINTPLGSSPLEKLKTLHLYEYSSANDSSSLDNQQPILNLDVYLHLEKLLEYTLENEEDITKEIFHIHNKMIFDSLNEVLYDKRPYSIKGKPTPWSRNQYKIYNQSITLESLVNLLQKSCQKVLEQSSLMCGFIVDKDVSVMGEEEQINQLKDDRLAKLLETEVVELEERWIDYEDQETEVLVELADLVFDQLVTETLEDIFNIKEKRKLEEEYYQKYNNDVY